MSGGSKVLRIVLSFTAFALVAVHVIEMPAARAEDAASAQRDGEALLTGKTRPPQVPADWIGSPTKSAPGWRWDDPQNAGNSVRIFRGNPADPDPAKRKDHVV